MVIHKNISSVQQELEAEGHRSIDVVMKKGRKDYHLAFVTARANGNIGSIKKTKVFIFF